MLRFEGELGPAVLLDGEARRPKSVLVVTGRAVGASETPAMHVPMTVTALIELQTSISLLRRQLRRMAARASDLPMRAQEWKIGERMGAEPDLLRQTRPTNARVTVLASIAELRLVHLRMTGNAVRAHAGRLDVAFIVAGLALRLRVTGGQTQPGMIGPDVVDPSPVGFVVTRTALGSGEGAVVRVLVAGHAVGLQSEKGRSSTAVLLVVTVLAAHRLVSALEWPARLAMVESLLSPSGPTHELGVSPEMLDMASAAGLLPILPRRVQALPTANPRAEVLVAAKTGFGIEAFARRVTFAAVRIAIDLGVGTG